MYNDLLNEFMFSTLEMYKVLIILLFTQVLKSIRRIVFYNTYTNG